MNNRGREDVEYHQVLASVSCHDSPVSMFKQRNDSGSSLVSESGMVASLTVVTDDCSIGGDVTNEIVITADDSLTISSDGDLTPIKQVDSGSNTDSLQSSEADRTLEGQIMFLHQQEQQQQQLHRQSHQQHVQGTTQQQVLMVQQSQQLQQSTQHQVLTASTPQQQSLQRARGQSGEVAIRPNISEIVSTALTTVTASSPSSVPLSNTISNGTVRINNMSVNLLATPTTVNTTVEQPNNGPCMCFVCGRHLSDPTERFYYLKTQKLFNTQVTLLELLSDVLNQMVVTNTCAVDLCSRCSELVNETDSAYTHLNRLKKQINGLFNNNQRPKLTFQVLPKPNNLNTAGTSPIPRLYQPPDLNLDDLAATRPRRGRQGRKTAKRTEDLGMESKINIISIKKKGGRPRKPFACHICKRKFLTKDTVSSHMVKEHDVNPVGLAKPILGSRGSPESVNGILDERRIGTTSAEMQQVKLEQDDMKDKIPLISIKSSPVKIETFPMNHLGSVTTINSTGRAIKPSLVPIAPKVGTDAASQLLASMRPIQPKPQTMIQTAPDGSMVLLMNPTVVDSSPTVIKVTPGYMSLKPGPYACDRCNKTFLDEKSRRMHRIAAHNWRKRKRDEEDDEEDDGGEKRDGHEKLWHCRLCEASFTKKKTLAEHRKAAHSRIGDNGNGTDSRKDRIHSCDQCDQMFGYKYELERHKETHVPYTQMGPHEFVCCVCGLKVASKAALKIHLHRFHSKYEETKDFLCSECGYMASTKKAFTDHQRIHSDDPGPKVRCTVCQKEMLASSYKIHMLRMHGEAKHPCETCGQRFTVRSDLMRHLNTVHSNLRPYDCDLCGEKFATSDALRYHRNKTHSTVLHYCEYCNKSYKWKGELRTHIQRNHMEHKERFQCSRCSRNYADRRKLRHHMLTKHSIPREMTYFKSYEQREKALVTYKAGGDQIPCSGYEPQGTLLPPALIPITPHSSSHHIQQPVVTHPQEVIQSQPSIVTIPVYHQHQHHPQQNLQHHEGIIASQQHQQLHHQTGHHTLHPASHQQQQHHMSNDVYIVPDLAVPLHEEQVTTS
nr:uncharacterized protein LOC123764831 [Procambarus clarkii]XP_045608990.1 uncharacterized protein LOC123764831 [Procambarus clarkii]